MTNEQQFEILKAAALTIPKEMVNAYGIHLLADPPELHIFVKRPYDRYCLGPTINSLNCVQQDFWTCDDKSLGRFYTFTWQEEE